MGTYNKGFAVVIEPTGTVVPGVYEPVMRLACLDASLAIKPVFERFTSVSVAVTAEAVVVVLVELGLVVLELFTLMVDFFFFSVK